MRRSLAAAIAVLALGWATAPAPAATVSIDAYGIATYGGGAGCPRRGAAAVVCTNGYGYAPSAHDVLGDGADTLTVHGGGVHALLGPGADRASADLGRLGVEGGPGPDAVSAAARTDVSVGY